ncbi:VV D6-like helicase [uncultured virus]|nr:VV D6-like helicase [uncultured virus]
MTPGFQTLITAKEEFAEMASDPGEQLPQGQGQFYKHQKFTLRYLRAYDDLIILDETGTGKSCSVLGFTEYTRAELEKAKVDPTRADEKAAHFKKVVVLVKGPTQKNEFKNQLICSCSDGHYVTGIVKRAKTETVQKTNISLEIKKAGYTVTTYTSFAHRINEKYSTLDKTTGVRTITEADNARLAEEYSDTIFWIDEAHNLLIDPGTTTTIREKQQTYSTIWRVLHLARRSKRIISTATPMINDEKEIGFLMNLILPLNGIIPLGYDYRNAPPNDIRVLFPGVGLDNRNFPENFDYYHATFEELRRYCPNLLFDPRIASPEQMAPYFLGQFPSDRLDRFYVNFSTATLADLEPFMRGRIGFIRATNTGAVPEEQGILQDDEYENNGVRYRSQLVIYATAMSEHQNNGYIAARNRGRDELFGAERQAANFVFPDGYWGNGITEDESNARKAARNAKAAIKAAIAAETQQEAPVVVETLPEGGFLPITAGVIEQTTAEEEEAGIEATGYERRAFRRYVTLRGDTFAATAEFAPWLQQLEFIRTLSCKFAEIVRLVMGEPGNAFVYGEFVEGSGAIVLALCLEGMGFVRYNESTSMFLGVGADTVKPVCSGSDRDAANRRVRPNILSRQQGAPMRYGLLTRDTSDAKFHSMMEAMNSYENRHGDYIKVLISSRVGRDGINVKNVLQIHLVGSEWNQSGIYQALSRGIRATSHDDLINEERDRLIAEGDTVTKPRISVKIYKHAALDENGSGIDLQMYRMAEYKDRSIKRVMRIMKQCAIGCQIHYNRNVLPTDVDGSAACDYDVCHYPCVDPAPAEKDFSTYDVLYASEIVTDAIGKIINIYRQRNAFTLNEIATVLPQYRRKYLIMALERLITNKTPLTDRFGYTTYLREDKGSFYLDRSYPTGIPPSYAMAYYTQGVIGIEQETLANIVVRLEAGEHQEVLAELEHMDPKDPQFDLRLGAISIEGQATILEEVLMRTLRGNRSDFTDAIILKFQRMIFPIHEPLTELNRVYETVAQRKPRRGRKPNPELKRRIKKINPITIDETKIVRDEDTEIVYLHTLYSQVINQTGYATTARFNKAEGRIRLLKPTEIDDGWRDLNEIELPVYNAFIQIEIARRNRPFEEHGIYGFILPDKKFRIRDRLTEAPGAADDARKIKRGKVCETWYRPDLIDVLYEVSAAAPGGFFPDFKEDQKMQLIQILLQRRINKSYEELLTWSIDRLIYYFKWYSATKVKREVICEIIKQRMAETGRLLT